MSDKTGKKGRRKIGGTSVCGPCDSMALAWTAERSAGAPFANVYHTVNTISLD